MNTAAHSRNDAAGAPGPSGRERVTRAAIEAMIRAGRRHHRLIEQRMETLGMHRSQHHMLMTLSRMRRTASQKAIADKLGISPAAVTRTLKTLEAGGLVEKSGGADGRRNEIAILPAGQQVVDDTHSLFRALDMAIFEGISDGEIEAMTATLERMLENIARLEETGAPEEAGEHQ